MRKWKLKHDDYKRIEGKIIEQRWSMCPASIILNKVKL